MSHAEHFEGRMRSIPAGDRTVSKTLLFAGAVLVSVFWFLVIYGSPGNVIFCCDAASYLVGARNIYEHGLTADVAFPGYRSVIVYLLIGAIEAIGGLFIATPAELDGLNNISVSYQFGALLSLAVGAVVAIAVGYGKPGFLLAFVAIYANPLMVAYAVLPLQESLFAIILAPALVILYAALRSQTWQTAFYAAAYLAGMSYMLKPSLILVSLVLMAMMLWMLLFKKVALHHLVAAFTIIAAITAPQLYASYQNAGTLMPYYSGNVMSSQLGWAISHWRYETVMFDDTFAGRRFVTPFDDLSLQEVMRSPGTLLALGIGHLVGAFDHWTLKTYVTDVSLPPFSGINVIVGAALFVALLHTVRRLVRQTASDFVLNAILIATVCVLPFLAVETRFAFLPMLVVVVRAAEWVQLSGSRILDGTMAVLFGTAFAFAASMIHHTAVFS